MVHHDPRSGPVTFTIDTDALEELVDGAVNTDDHRGLAETPRTFTPLFLVTSGAMAWFDRRHARGGPSWAGQAGAAMAGLATVFSVLATIRTIRTGEEGVRLVWSGVFDSLPQDK